MKKFFIGLGLTIFLLLAGLWVYLLLFGAPASTNDLFVNLGFREPTLERINEALQNTVEPSTQVSLGAELQQLTTRPVAGFVLVVSTTTNKIRYAEKGTGHIYEINLADGLETRISGNTIAKVTGAHFSKDGEGVALLSESGGLLRATLHIIGGGVSNDLPPNIDNIHLTDSTHVQYTKVSEDQTIAYNFDSDSGTTTELWNIPLTKIRVYWTDSRTIIVNQVAPSLRGGVYELNGNHLLNLVEPHYALVAKADHSGLRVLYSYYNLEEARQVSGVLDITTGVSKVLPIPTIPEKCDFNVRDTDRIWCASAPYKTSADRGFVTDWYKGVVTSEDALWESSLEYETSALTKDLALEAGFAIDVKNLTVSENGDHLLFTNKLNDTLWLYRLPKHDDIR